MDHDHTTVSQDSGGTFHTTFALKRDSDTWDLTIDVPVPRLEDESMQDIRLGFGIYAGSVAAVSLLWQRPAVCGAGAAVNRSAAANNRSEG